jgi:hypothetical protein
MKQFNNKAILTSKNPEAFLNFIYDGTSQWIIPDCCVGPKILYINGLDVNDYMGTPSLGYALKLDSTNTTASFQAYTENNYNWDLDLKFNVYTSLALTTHTTADISLLNRPFITPLNTFTNEDILIDDEASYMLMRTNPKFTGNVKLYVDCSNNIFLDTFKVSDILSNKKYRHQQISSNSVLSSFQSRFRKQNIKINIIQHIIMAQDY